MLMSESLPHRLPKEWSQASDSGSEPSLMPQTARLPSIGDVTAVKTSYRLGDVIIALIPIESSLIQSPGFESSSGRTGMHSVLTEIERGNASLES